MLSKLRKFFRAFFPKKDSLSGKSRKPSPQPAEKKPGDQFSRDAEKLTVSDGIPAKESPDTDASQKAKDTWAEKLARRRANRKKRKSSQKKETSGGKPGWQVNKHGLPILREKDSLLELFAAEKDENQTDTKETADMPEHWFADESFQRVLQEKEEGIQPVRPMRVWEKIRNYPLPEAELDLHGFTARKAEARTEAFIYNAHRKGLRTLRIIVGKGTRSKGRAVLPDVVETTVVRLKKKQLVFTFKWEKAGKLRSGAMIVYLR